METKIAVVQFEINQFAPEENLKKAEQFIARASSEAQIIVFPEDFVVGCGMDYAERYRNLRGIHRLVFDAGD